ncbi:MAG TPA: BON domain-containing protein [Burkholderiaceae bacterium]
MHNVIHTPSRMRPVAALAALLAVAALAACDRPNSPQTAGEKVDNAMARAEQKTEQAKEQAKSTANDMKEGAERMAGDAANSVKDAAITTAVNAKIAGDPSLSVLRINVDTVNGRVVLRGSAPDAAAKDRAQQLASNVEGVLGVDNQLVVGGKG